MGRAVVGLALVFVVVAVVFTLSGDDDPIAPPVEPRPAPETVTDPAPPPVVPGEAGATPGVASPGPATTGEPAAAASPLLVRLVDAATGTPIADLSGLVLSWDDRKQGRRGPLPAKEGWFRLPKLGDTGPLEFGVPGYARAALDPKTARGRVELSMAPVPEPAAGGLILYPGDVRHPVPVQVRLRRLDHDRSLPEFAVIGLPVQNTTFRLYDLPEGLYEMEVTSIVDGVCVRAKRAFRHLGGTTEIGRIELVRWAGIRARVVDLDGRVVPQAKVVIVREEEDERKGRIIEPDQQGWVTFADFEPGAWHRVAALDLPGPLERLVAAPEERGGLVTVELAWPGRLTTCVLHFRRGRDPLPATGIRGLPVPIREDPSTDPATVTVALLPGEYSVTWALAGGPPTAIGATFRVPEEPRFESVIRLGRTPARK